MKDADRRPRWVLPAACLALAPLVLLGVAVGGAPGVILVLIYVAITLAIALED